MKRKIVVKPIFVQSICRAYLFVFFFAQFHSASFVVVRFTSIELFERLKMLRKHFSSIRFFIKYFHSFLFSVEVWHRSIIRRTHAQTTKYNIEIGVRCAFSKPPISSIHFAGTFSLRLLLLTKTFCHRRQAHRQTPTHWHRTPLNRSSYAYA